MFLLFTSNSESKYKRDALAAISLPSGSVIRFRYDAKYVCDKVQEWKCRSDGTVRLAGSDDALFVYAQSDANDRTKPFVFFPLRLGQVVRVQRVGITYYVDVALQGYPDLGVGSAKQDQVIDRVRQAIVGASATYPLPSPPVSGRGLTWLKGSTSPAVRNYPLDPNAIQGSNGVFFDWQQNFNRMDCAVDDSSGWQRIVAALSDSDLKDAAFFRVGGFFRVTRWPWFGRFVDSRVLPTPRWPEVEYAFPMGSHVVMTIEMLRPSGSSLKSFQLSVETGGDSLAAVEPKKLLFESRYDQNRVIIASRRVLDAVMTTLGVSCLPTPGQTGLPFAPTLAFIIRVRPSRGITLVAPIAAAVAALLFSMSPDFIAGVGDVVKSESRFQHTGHFLIAAKAEIAVIAKALAVALSILAAWLVFRKAPVGK